MPYVSIHGAHIGDKASECVRPRDCSTDCLPYPSNAIYWMPPAILASPRPHVHIRGHFRLRGPRQSRFRVCSIWNGVLLSHRHSFLGHIFISNVSQIPFLNLLNFLTSLDTLKSTSPPRSTDSSLCSLSIGNQPGLCPQYLPRTLPSQ